MRKAHIDQQQCDRSPLCPAKRACPKKAIVQESPRGIFAFMNGGALTVSPDQCTGCSVCVTSCPRQAISMK